MSAGLLQSAYRPEGHHTGAHNEGTMPASITLSRKDSTSSTVSQKSEPSWLTAMNGIDRSRPGSVASQRSSISTKSASSGFSKLFGGKSKGEKKEKKRKDNEQIVLTSRHTAAVKNKLASDPKYQKAVRKDSQPQATPLVIGTQTSAHLTAHEQETRRPHSGPPSLRTLATVEKDTSHNGMPYLTRIISGDEADEPDEWERQREEWRTRKIPGAEMLQVLEGQTLNATGPTIAPSSDTATPEEELNNVPETKIMEREGVKLVTAAQNDICSEDSRLRPERQHTPIGGRWKKDDKGVWKR